MSSVAIPGRFRRAAQLGGVLAHLVGAVREDTDQLQVRPADDRVQRAPADVAGGPLDHFERPVEPRVVTPGTRTCSSLCPGTWPGLRRTSGGPCGPCPPIGRLLAPHDVLQRRDPVRPAPSPARCPTVQIGEAPRVPLRDQGDVQPAVRRGEVPDTRRRRTTRRRDGRATPPATPSARILAPRSRSAAESRSRLARLAPGSDVDVFGWGTAIPGQARPSRRSGRR